MKVEAQYHEPETTKGRQPYRLRIEGKDGQVIELTEQLTGGFSIRAATDLDSRLVVYPLTQNIVAIETVGRR